MEGGPLASQSRSPGRESTQRLCTYLNTLPTEQNELRNKKKTNVLCGTFFIYLWTAKESQCLFEPKKPLNSSFTPKKPRKFTNRKPNQPPVYRKAQTNIINTSSNSSPNSKQSSSNCSSVKVWPRASKRRSLFKPTVGIVCSEKLTDVTILVVEHSGIFQTIKMIFQKCWLTSGPTIYFKIFLIIVKAYRLQISHCESVMITDFTKFSNIVGFSCKAYRLQLRSNEQAQLN